jgi:hypothetical protein
MSRRTHYYGTNRYICDVLKEMRTCYETHNYALLPSLIEECQTLANRMEAAIHDVEDIKTMQEDRSKLKKEIRELEAKAEELEKGVENE